MNFEPATLPEVLDFCNKVREAGGANPLEALLPGVPEDTQSCLIATNLNFHCEVVAGFPGDMNRWGMFFHDTPENRELVDQIAEELGLRKWEGNASLAGPTKTQNRSNYPAVAVVLPKEIGQVASDYDGWWANSDEFEEADWMQHEFAELVDPGERDSRRVSLFNVDA